jgi:plasmid maintenance system antidote protein VapI
MLVRGISPGEIAEMMGVERQTIYNDVRAIRSTRNVALLAHARHEIVAQMVVNMQARWRFLWHLAEHSHSDHVKVQAMRELRLNDAMMLKKVPVIVERQEWEMTKEWMEAKVAEMTERVEGLVRRRKWMEDHNVWPVVPEEDMEELRKDDFVFDDM